MPGTSWYVRLRRTALVLFPLACLTGWTTTLHAQSGETVPRERRVLRAEPLSTPLTIDGRLDEPVYRAIAPIGGFTQYEPRNGQAATESTEAWIFFDSRNLYISVRNRDSQPARMVMNELRHDATTLTQNEQVSVTLDTFRDRRNGFVFLVSATGGMLEEAFTDERNANRDWNTIWDAKVSRSDRGWDVEMMIPFRSIRYRAGDSSWGIQIGRSIKWKNEITFVSPLPVLSGPPVYRISYGATLDGIQAPEATTNIDLKPYAITDLTTDRTAKPSYTNRTHADGGFDVKYGLTRNLIADVTVNTDFAQVEEDEQQVNLTRFNLFFPEKRDFFLEGQGTFNFGGVGAGAATDVPIMFFSRSVGFARGQPQDILAGARVTGKSGPYSIGVVHIQTRDEPRTGAPATRFSVVRVRRDILKNSAIGLLLTDRSMSTRPDGGHNVLGGVDGVFTFAQYLRVNTYLARTSTTGLTGDDWSYRGQIDYAGDRYGAGVERVKVGSDFNPEVGFMRRLDFSKTSATLRFSPRPVAGGALSRRIRKLSYEGAYNYYQTGAGEPESRDVLLQWRAEFQTSDALTVSYTRNHDRLESPFAIAPGVRLPTGTYEWQQGQIAYTAGTQRRVSGTTTVSSGTYYNGTQRAFSFRGRVALATRLSIEPGVSRNWLDFQQGSFTATLIGARVTAPLTPRMFASVLLQYNSSNHSYGTNARFRWEYQPGSELFVVFTEGRNTLGPGVPLLDTRGFVVKLTRLFRM